MRGAIYLRISRESADSTSISRQEQACRGRAQSLGIDHVDVYQDVDRSGYDPTTERPAFNELLTKLDSYSHLIVYRIDRLTRQGARHLLTIVEDHLQPDTALVSATEPIDTSGPFGEMFLVLLSTLAKMESERLGERSRDTKRYLREHGYWFAGKPPYGYQAVEDESGHKRLVTDVTASKVRDACDRILDGDSLTDVAATFPLTYTGVQKLLTNPVIAGYQTNNGSIVFDEMGEPVTVTDDPIISPATFRQLQAMFDGSGHSRARKHLLTGLLTCDVCGGSMTGRPRAYVCQDCDSNSASRTRVERIVTDHVKSLLPTILAKGAEEEAKNEDGDEEGREVHLRTLLAQLNDSIDDLTIDKGLDYSSPQVARLEERARKVQESLLELKQTPDLVQFPAPNVTADNFDDYKVDIKRRIIKYAIDLSDTDYIIIRKADGTGGRFDPARVVLPQSELGGI